MKLPSLPNRLILIGFFLVLAGAVLPFLIILDILPSTFTLNFLAFAASMAGIFMGLIGSAMYAGIKRRDRQRDEWYDQ